MNSSDRLIATEEVAKASVELPESTNISKGKREDLLNKIAEIRSFIAKSEQDKNTAQLMAYLGDLEKDVNGKKYGLVFEEHRESIDEVLDNYTPVLTEDEDLFIDNGGNVNFLIEGDNLASLKLLEKTHRGRIDLIYIDPPYNTKKKDFVYNDKIVDANDTFKHSKWTSFIYNRIKAARTLLSNDGTIFISISDIELFSLKLICDQIFGAEKFVTAIPRIAKQQRSAQEKHMDISHDYVLCYSYSEDFERIVKRDYDESKIKEDHIGKYIENDTKAILADKSKGYSAGGDYDFEYNGKIYQPVDKNGVRNRWLWTKKRMEEAARLGILVETPTSLRMQLYLDYKFDDKTNKMVSKNPNLIFHTSDFMTKNCYSNSTGSNELKKLGTDLFQKFNNPKPISLIMDLCKLSTNENSIVLDFFAGSGTTGHAVMKLNAEDGGNRKFILCTNNENNICRDVTYERIKRVIDKEDYQASLKYYQVQYIPIEEKMYYEYADSLLLHIRELVELENGINFNGNAEIAIVLTDEELEEFIGGIDENNKCRKLYMGHDLLPDEEQDRILKDNEIEICIIPDYYYRDLQER